MHNASCFVSDWWLVSAILLFAVFGLGTLATAASQLPNAFRNWLRGEPPKPRKYRITIEDYDGWPMRSFKLPVEAAARLVHDLDRDNPA